MTQATTPISVTDQTLHEIISWLRDRLLLLAPGDTITLDIPDPDRCIGCYAGETFTHEGRTFRHRSWRSWNDLATLLMCRMLTPERINEHTVRVHFQKLDPKASFHYAESDSEKYGALSSFARIDKREEPTFWWHYEHALHEVTIAQRRRILDLGINTGDEFAAIETLLGTDHTVEMVGIDHSPSAIEHARSHLPHATFHCHDINELSALNLGRFDLLISVGTLQSPGIDTKPLVMNLVQNYLTDDGALILGFPNSRWIDGELIPGAHAPNSPFSELSLVIKDIHWTKKYLQQHRYRVRIIGTSYLFLVATRIGKK
jgi:trans-aconitate methyltransferase